MTNFQKYCLKHNELSYKYLSKKFDLSYFEMSDQLCGVWDKFDNPHMVDNMLVTNYKKQRWYYELCDTKYNRGKVLPINYIQDYWIGNQEKDQHTSMYAHDQAWVEDFEGSGSVSNCGEKLFLPMLWVEIDRKDYGGEVHPKQAMKDGHKLADKFSESFVMTSGNASSHILLNGAMFGNPIINRHNWKVIKILVSIISAGLRFDKINSDPTYYNKKILKRLIQEYYPRYNTENFKVQRAINALENVDMNVYHPNALMRQPWSYHESGGDQKKDDLPPRKLEFTKNKPENLHLYWKAWDKYEKIKNKINKNVEVKHKKSYIVNIYKDYYPDIEHADVNKDGWTNKRFHNVFYEDGNADVVFNMETGYMKDFGSRRFSMSLKKFKRKIKDDK